MIRPLAALALLPLAGCAPFNEAAGAFAGVDAVVALPVFGRTTTDLLYSIIAGRDCSIVHLEQGKRYCAAREPPPERGPFCTPSLGVADCWSSAAAAPPGARPLGDTPALTPEQEADRTASWPRL